MKVKRHNYNRYLNYIPVFIIFALILTIYFTGIYHLFTFHGLRDNHVLIQNYVKDHPFLAPFIFIGIYTLTVISIIPYSSILALLGGYLFPFPLALFYCVVSEILGAFIFFIFLGKAMPPPKKKFLKKLSEKFRIHAASYLLFLRWSHFIPFTLINSFAAYFHVKKWTFIWTTFIGVIPLCYLLVSEGHNLSAVFVGNEHYSLSNIFNLNVKITFLVFAVLALFPLAYHHWKVKLHKKKKH